MDKFEKAWHSIKWQEKIFYVVCLFSPFLWGGFYEFSAYLFGLLLIIAIMGNCIKRKKQSEKKTSWNFNYVGIGLLIYSAAYWASIIFAVDRGSAFLGAVKFTVPFLFWAAASRAGEKTREELVRLIPTVGAVMVFISLIGAPIPACREFLYQAGRLGGFFQYSNVMALYLLIGLIILNEDTDKTVKRKFTETALLIAGILLTGSRTVFVMLAAFTVYVMITNKTLRWKIAALSVVIVSAGGVYAFFTGDYQNVGRFFTTSFRSSTLLGRLLYNIDGLHLLKEHLFGVGYLGYYFMQPKIQTGVYSTMFVHNDWLQTALDAGILALSALLLIVIRSVCSKTVSKRNKLVILAICFHMLLDFDIQYMSIFFILVLMLNDKRNIHHTRKTLKKQPVMEMFARKGRYTAVAGSVFGGIGSVIYTVCFLSGILFFFGKWSAADAIYPWNSRAKEALMLESTEEETAEELADEILKLNPYSYAAYNIKAVVALSEGNYEEMLQNKRKAVEITRYNIAEYEDYVVLLSKAIANSPGDEMQYIEELDRVTEMLKKTEAQTHPLAYEIQDKPQFTLGEEYQEYIENR